MRRGFTMIELIFVIVILGILAAVALPKFVGVSEQAQLGNVKSFAGTLNRTVFPSLWSKAMMEGKNGKISDLPGAATFDMSKYVDIPEVIGSSTFDLTKCDNSASNGSSIATATVGDKTVQFYCFEGNSTVAPYVTFVAGKDKNLTIQ